jgi:hypothetical protein
MIPRPNPILKLLDVGNVYEKLILQYGVCGNEDRYTILSIINTGLVYKTPTKELYEGISQSYKVILETFSCFLDAPEHILIAILGILWDSLESPISSISLKFVENIKDPFEKFLKTNYGDRELLIRNNFAIVVLLCIGKNKEIVLESEILQSITSFLKNSSENFVN